jgi:AcrR family transcriptional regulator
MSSTERGRPDGRQLRWDKHNQARRRIILDAAIAVLEDSEPGEEIHVQQIAQRAGLSRTVVYRHFSDRADLDRAVQAAILEMLAGELLPEVTLDGTIEEIIRRIVGTYVGWTVAHPSLHRFAEHDVPDSDGTSALEVAVVQIATRVEDIITVGAERLGAPLSDEDAAALDPLVFGLVGTVLGATRRWLSRPERRPDPETFVGMLSDSVWHIIDGHARRLGIELDPHIGVERLFAGSTDEEPAR